MSHLPETSGPLSLSFFTCKDHSLPLAAALIPQCLWDAYCIPGMVSAYGIWLAKTNLFWPKPVPTLMGHS